MAASARKRDPKSNTKAADAVDIEVARLIRVNRIQKRMSQTQLGAACGITFQQIQKYEKAVNRVTAGRLHTIAVALGLPMTEFYASVPQIGKDPDRDIIARMLSTGTGANLAAAFVKIQDQRLRRQLVDLANVMAANAAAANTERRPRERAKGRSAARSA